MPTRTILVIDDEPALCRLLKDTLGHAGYQIYTAATGPEGLQQFSAHQPDLVILDIMMPDMDGWEVCRRIRRHSDVPVIMLTALSEETEIIRGLGCGADDYVTKPFSSSVLLARTEAVLRRATRSFPTRDLIIYSDGYLTIDLEAHRVLIRTHPIKLSETEYRLLAHLFQNAGRVLTFREILERVWGQACRYNVEYVHVYMSHLRQKLEENPQAPVYLLSEYGVGYRFEKQPG
jgi:two-component system KDP operon response regulator KdpE